MASFCASHAVASGLLVVAAVVVVTSASDWGAAGPLVEEHGLWSAEQLADMQDSGKAKEAMDEVLTMDTGLLFLLLVYLCGTSFSWCLLLEGDPRPQTVRKAMVAVLVVGTALEIIVCLVGEMERWTALAIIGANIWCSLDAIIRYPILPGWISFFALKQLLVHPFKISCYFLGSAEMDLGFPKFNGSVLCCVVIMVMNVLFLPLMYYMAFPDEDSKHYQKLKEKDADSGADVLFYIARFLLSPQRWCACATWCRRTLVAMLEALAKCSPWVCRMVMVVDPSYSRFMKKHHRV